MVGYTQILEKLNKFTAKYYGKMLIKGFLLFIAFGVLFFFAVLLVEYMLWLNPTWRFLLFMVFIGFELLLFLRYIATPIFYLLKLKKGISSKEASLLIGKHFPEVDDRLYNLLELAEDKNRSELLLASIEQRSENMNPIPFTKAVDYRENVKYAKFLVFPALVFSLIWLSGNLADFFGSADRVVNYNMAFEPPAPFSFQLLSNDLNVLENESYTIEVNTVGELQPESVFMVLGGVETAMKKQNGRYQYEMTPPLGDTNFYFYANGVRSKTYSLKVLKTPLILDFRIELDYPDYLGKSSEFLTGTGNATFPEGTKATWVISSQNTDEIRLSTIDTIIAFTEDQPRFTLSKSIYSDLSYELTTSNLNVSNYEKLAYRFNVIKDGYPNIKVNEVRDSLNPNISYYIGEASDDYKLNSIKLVYFPLENKEREQVIELALPNSNFEQFYYTFPSGLQLEPGIAYGFYFTATDNDGIRKGKTTKSQIFSMDLLDDAQLKNKELEAQQSLIENLDRSLGKFKEQKESLKEINQLQKEKNQLNFNDQDQIKSFLEKQELQENLMQKFSKQLQQNLNKGEKDDTMNKLLQERLERQEIQAQKNEKLLEELNKIADKINKDELTKRLEELGKRQQTSERNLEQLLELTKRYYVTEKAEQLARDLKEEAKRQEELSKQKAGQDFTDKEQKNLNDDFKKLSEELDELKKDNEDLKKPLQLNIDKDKQTEIENDQQDAFEEIKNHQGLDKTSQSEEKQKAADGASEKQKSAAEKMKQMSEDLQQAASASEGESSDAEDAEMLRQVLDNLITFSFKQENLYDKLEVVDAETTSFSSTVRAQQELRTLFEHVDDSLFALSLRRAELSEFVNEQITEVYYNMDKTLESLAESQIYQGVSYQKYVLNASNSLADFLAHILDNMQQSMMPGQGQGQGQDFQLPDIIKGQSELKEKMEGMGQSGEGESKSGEGEGSEGEGQQQGQGESNSGKGDRQGNGEKGNNGFGNGKSDGSSSGQGQGESSEAELREIYEIYKEQQQLREELERQLQDMMNSGDRKLGEKLLRQMEDFQNDLLEHGITQRTLSKINQIQYELLKLENAALKQGKKTERESSTNKRDFQNPIISKPTILENYRNEVEILNREALPLREDFRYRVKEYFKTDD